MKCMILWILWILQCYCDPSWFGALRWQHVFCAEVQGVMEAMRTVPCKTHWGGEDSKDVMGSYGHSWKTERMPSFQPFARVNQVRSLRPWHPIDARFIEQDAPNSDLQCFLVIERAKWDPCFLEQKMLARNLWRLQKNLTPPDPGSKRLQKYLGLVQHLGTICWAPQGVHWAIPRLWV